MTDNKVLSITDISFIAANGRAVVDHVNIVVRPGEVLGIIGPSGAGKTTLFRLITGLLRPANGRIGLGAADITSQPVNRRAISYLQQEFSLYTDLTVLQNVLVAFEDRSSLSDVREQATRMLLTLGLRERSWPCKPQTLSGGEAQRVALAKALLRPCSVLLLDEPMSNVDKARKTEMGALIRDVVRDNYIAAIYVTHDEHELLLTSDLIAVMKDGRLLQAGRYRELEQSPNSREVASIGSGVGLQTFTREDWIAVTAPTALNIRLPDDCAFLGWRAEASRLHFGAHSRIPDALVLQTTIDRVVKVGRTVYVSLMASAPLQSRLLWHVGDAHSVDANMAVGGSANLCVDLGALFFMDRDGQVLARPEGI